MNILPHEHFYCDVVTKTRGVGEWSEIELICDYMGQELRQDESIVTAIVVPIEYNYDCDDLLPIYEFTIDGWPESSILYRGIECKFWQAIK